MCSASSDIGIKGGGYVINMCIKDLVVATFDTSNRMGRTYIVPFLCELENSNWRTIFP